MIPLAVPSLDGNESRYLQECIESTFVPSVGPFVGRFEDLVAAATGARQAVAVASGIAALRLALLAVGVRRDDLVVLPSFTFIASANPEFRQPRGALPRPQVPSSPAPTR